MKYKITEKELIKAHMQIGLGTIKTRIVLALCCTILMLTGYFLKSKIGNTMLYAGSFGVIGYFVALAIIPFQAKSAYRSYKILQMPVSLSVDEAGITFSREIGTFFLAWDNIYSWKNFKDFIVVMASKKVFYLIPKSQIGRENANIIAERLVKNVGFAS